MNIDLKEIPFSRYGANLAFSKLNDYGGDSVFSKTSSFNNNIYLKKVQGSTHLGEILSLNLTKNGINAKYIEEVSPSLLKLTAVGSQEGSVEICFPEPDTVLLRVKRCDLIFERNNPEHVIENIMPTKDNGCRMITQNSIIEMITLKNGHLKLNTQQRLVQTNDLWHFNNPYVKIELLPKQAKKEAIFIIREYETQANNSNRKYDFDKCLKQIQSEFDNWYKNMPGVSTRYSEAAKKAAYILWSSVISSRGHYKNNVMVMSTNYMERVWNWDNYFNSLASSINNFDFAWKQFMLFFNYQNEKGALPDCIRHNNIIWRYTKPPIHGWALKYIIEQSSEIENVHLSEIYPKLASWTDWWFEYRDEDQDGLPNYYYGNDSGMDNATIFDIGFPMKSPDLQTYLIIQLDTLSHIAKKLNKFDESIRWKKRADQLMDKMIRKLWNGERFIGKRAVTGEVSDQHDCILSYMPILLGDRLPKDIKDKLIEGLKKEGHFLTSYGLATESINSTLYLSHGHCRGGMWAPIIMLIIDGIKRSGEEELAVDIAKRYCETLLKSNFYESYEAKTGKELFCPAYTWTASVFLLLAHEYLN